MKPLGPFDLYVSPLFFVLSSQGVNDVDQQQFNNQSDLPQQQGQSALQQHESDQQQQHYQSNTAQQPSQNSLVLQSKNIIHSKTPQQHLLSDTSSQHHEYNPLQQQQQQNYYSFRHQQQLSTPQQQQVQYNLFQQQQRPGNYYQHLNASQHQLNFQQQATFRQATTDLSCPKSLNSFNVTFNEQSNGSNSGNGARTLNPPPPSSTLKEQPLLNGDNGSQTNGQFKGQPFSLPSDQCSNERTETNKNGGFSRESDGYSLSNLVKPVSTVAAFRPAEQSLTNR